MSDIYLDEEFKTFVPGPFVDPEQDAVYKEFLKLKQTQTEETSEEKTEPDALNEQGDVHHHHYAKGDNPDDKKKREKDAQAKAKEKTNGNGEAKAKSNGEEKPKLDPVGKEDGDIDNDGDKDKSDKYLAKKRKAIGKSIKAQKKTKNEKPIKLSGESDKVEVHKGVEEGTRLQVKMALGDAGVEGDFDGKNVKVHKKNIKKAQKALKGNVYHKGKAPNVVAHEDVQIDEMPNRAYKEKINALLKDYHGKFKWKGEELYVSKEIEKDVRNIISKDKGHSYMIKVSSNPMREEIQIDENVRRKLRDFATDLAAYAKSKGGIDKQYFEKIAQIAASGQIPAAKDIDNDTDPRDFVLGMMAKSFPKQVMKNYTGISPALSHHFEESVDFDTFILESTEAYAKSLKKIARDKAIKMLKPGEHDKIKKIRDMMKHANEEKTLGKYLKREGVNHPADKKSGWVAKSVQAYKAQKKKLKKPSHPGYGTEESVEENIAYLKNKDGHVFHISKRDKKGDKFSMSVKDKSGKTIKDWGSHPSLDGAKKFAGNRGFTEEVNTGNNRLKAIEKDIDKLHSRTKHMKYLKGKDRDQMRDLSRKRDEILKSRSIKGQFEGTETVDEIAPVVAGAARLAVSAGRGLAKVGMRVAKKVGREVRDRFPASTNNNEKTEGTVPKYANRKTAQAEKKAREDAQRKRAGLDEARKSDYQLYHKDFSSAMQHAYEVAKKRGYIVDKDDIDNKVATGPRKPSNGKTNRYILGTDKKQNVHIQVANLDNKRYELNMYVEEVDLDEKQQHHISGNSMVNKLYLMNQAKAIAKEKAGPDKEHKISDWEKLAKQMGFSRRKYEEIGDHQGIYESATTQEKEDMANKGSLKLEKVLSARKKFVEPEKRAGEWGTDELSDNYKEETPGQNVKEGNVIMNDRDPYRIFEQMVHYLMGTSIKNIEDYSFYKIESTPDKLRLENKEGALATITLSDVQNFYDDNDMAMDEFIEMMVGFGVKELSEKENSIVGDEGTPAIGKEKLGHGIYTTDPPRTFESMDVYSEFISSNEKNQKNGFTVTK